MSMLKGPSNEEVSSIRQVLSYLTDQVASGYGCRPWDHPSSGNSGTEIVYPYHPRKGLVLEEVGQGKPRF